MTFGPPNSQGQFVDYTIVLPEEDKEMKLKITDFYQQLASAINNREISIYSLQELPNGSQFFNLDNPQLFRSAYRKVMDFVELNNGNLAPSTNYKFPHNIQNVSESAQIYANCTTLLGRRLTLVYPQVWIDGTDAHFNNLALNLTQCDIIINVLKN